MVCNVSYVQYVMKTIVKEAQRLLASLAVDLFNLGAWFGLCRECEHQHPHGGEAPRHLLHADRGNTPGWGASSQSISSSAMRGNHAPSSPVVEDGGVVSQGGVDTLPHLPGDDEGSRLDLISDLISKAMSRAGMGSAEPPRKLTLDGGEVLIDGLRQGRILDVVRARPELHERIWVLAWQRSKAGRLGGIYSEASPAGATAAPHPPAAGSPFNQSLPPDVSGTCVR